MQNYLRKNLKILFILYHSKVFYHQAGAYLELLVPDKWDDTNYILSISSSLTAQSL